MAAKVRWDVSGFERHRTEKSVPFWCDACARTKTAKSRYTGVADGRRRVICTACHGEMLTPADA